MPRSGNTTVPSAPGERLARPSAPDILRALVMVWSAREPHRLGEVAFLGRDAEYWLGRDRDATAPTHFFRQRPGELSERRPLIGESMSRRQLHIESSAHKVEIKNEGNAALLVNGRPAQRANLSLGDVVEIRGHYSFLFIDRPSELPRSAFLPKSLHAFGERDANGILGESPAAWALRDQIGAAATYDSHVLVLGETGSGKELTARAVHALSRRARGPLVARNAATLPSGLAAAELFGNLKNFPNPGMPERKGLVGEADKGTLFLDEIGELPEEIQSQLLRVLDGDGEYQRIGEGHMRHASFRLIGATNRDESSLKHDIANRFEMRIDVPSLDVRREDIPLIVRELVLAEAKSTPEGAERFVYQGDLRPEIHIDAGFITTLLLRPYPGNVRDIKKVLKQALVASATSSTIALVHTPPAAPQEPRKRAPSEAAVKADPGRSAIMEALDKHRWKRVAAARELGISRHRIDRLIKKHGLA